MAKIKNWSLLGEDIGKKAFKKGRQSYYTVADYSHDERNMGLAVRRTRDSTREKKYYAILNEVEGSKLATRIIAEGDTKEEIMKKSRKWMKNNPDPDTDLNRTVY